MPWRSIHNETSVTDVLKMAVVLISGPDGVSWRYSVSVQWGFRPGQDISN